MEQVVILYGAPIPVGNRVEVRWMQGPARKRALGGSSPTTQPFEPIVRDLDTGVEYVPDWVLEHGGSLSTHRPLTVAEQPKDELEVARTLVGVVRHCRVVTIRWSDYNVQTHLGVDTGFG